MHSITMCHVWWNPICPPMEVKIIIYVWIAGWWFGTFFIFPYIGNNHHNWLIFFRGVSSKTNQIAFSIEMNQLLGHHDFDDFRNPTWPAELRRSISPTPSCLRGPPLLRRWHGSGASRNPFHPPGLAPETVGLLRNWSILKPWKLGSIEYYRWLIVVKNDISNG